MLSIYKSPLMRAFFFYDYPFSTPTKNAVNKRIIERPISFPRLRRGKDKDIVLYSRCFCGVSAG